MKPSPDAPVETKQTIWYNKHCHTNGNGALFVFSADVFNSIVYWVKHPVLLDFRPAVRVTTSANNTGCFVMFKRCNKCGKLKHYSRFHKNPKTADGLYTACKLCCAEYQKEYRRKNKKKISQDKKRYVEENRETILAKKRKYAAENREQESARATQWQKDNPEKVKMRSKLRRFRERANGGEVSQKDWNKLMALCDYRCLCCGKKKKLEMDHIISVVDGGTGSIDNLQPLCRSCNASKNTDSIDYRPTHIKKWADKRKRG